MKCFLCEEEMMICGDVEEGKDIITTYHCKQCNIDDYSTQRITPDGNIELNVIHNIECSEGMKLLPDSCIDMILTSPPYDNLRNYDGYSFEFEKIAKELYRILKQGGVMVWVVGDSTINGSETLTSFEQAIYLKKIGFKVHDTMIYEKHNPVPNAGKRYQQSFEYMFVFSKGTPKTTNILTEKRRNECNDKRVYRKKKFTRNKDGDFEKEHDYFVKEYVPRRNIWTYKVGLYNSTSDKIAFKHPAIFPEKLAEDHILSWSEPGDIILDPFMGSGTTAKMAIINHRNYIGYEINEEFSRIAYQRVRSFTRTVEV